LNILNKSILAAICFAMSSQQMVD